MSNEPITARSEYASYILMMLAIMFAVVDNLFLGYFIWQHLGALAFVAISLLNAPISSLYRYYSYSKFYKECREVKVSTLWEKFIEQVCSPAAWAYFLLFLAAVIGTVFLYNIYYGAMFIQILKLFVTQMGLTSSAGYYLTMSLVLCSVIPDAILNVKDLFYKLSRLWSWDAFSDLLEDKKGHIIALVILVTICSFIFAHIEFSQAINSYQHFMIEVLEVFIPYVANKTLIFSCIFINVFAQLYGMAVSFLTWVQSFESHSPLDYEVKSYGGIFCLIVIGASRAIGQFLMTGELASNPFNINAQRVAIFKSVTGDYSCYADGVGKKSVHPHVEMMMQVGLAVMTLSFLVLGFTHVIQLSTPILLASVCVGLLVSYFYPPQVVLLLDNKAVSASSFEVFRDIPPSTTLDEKKPLMSEPSYVGP